MNILKPVWVFVIVALVFVGAVTVSDFIEELLRGKVATLSHSLEGYGLSLS